MGVSVESKVESLEYPDERGFSKVRTNFRTTFAPLYRVHLRPFENICEGIMTMQRVSSNVCMYFCSALSGYDSDDDTYMRRIVFDRIRSWIYRARSLASLMARRWKSRASIARTMARCCNTCFLPATSAAGELQTYNHSICITPPSCLF